MNARGIIGIIVGMGLLIVLAYKNMNVVIFAPLCALLIGLTNGMNLIEVITVNYMQGFQLLISMMFFVVILGALIITLVTAPIVFDIFKNVNCPMK